MGVSLYLTLMDESGLKHSYRYFGAMLPSALNVFTMQGFLILNCIIGGQTLASVSDHLDDTLGIVIIGVISMLVS